MENTSDSFMPRPLLFCLKSGRSVCYSVPDNNRAREAADVTEKTNTWAGWKALGYEVIHGSRALFGVDLIWGSKGDGAVYKARFFGKSQVREVAG